VTPDAFRAPKDCAATIPAGLHAAGRAVTDHHIQHVYTKVGVSTRAAASLWAMQNGVVQ